MYRARPVPPRIGRTGPVPTGFVNHGWSSSPSPSSIHRFLVGFLLWHMVLVLAKYYMSLRRQFDVLSPKAALCAWGRGGWAFFPFFLSFVFSFIIYYLLFFFSFYL
jgi:hypothetical protein